MEDQDLISVYSTFDERTTITKRIIPFNLQQVMEDFGHDYKLSPRDELIAVKPHFTLDHDGLPTFLVITDGKPHEAP